MVFTDEFLRILQNDREKQIQERIRVRRLIGPRQPTIRWRSGRRQVGRPDAQEGEGLRLRWAARSERAGESSVSKDASRTGARVGARSQVRIIGGRWKRTPLPVADAAGLRPSPDRVRETLFNWLAHFIPDFTAVRGLDLFAGTGALGFELASRGAASVTLVERQPALVDRMLRTRNKLGADAVSLVQGDAFAVARSIADAAYDVVFLDPPFDAGVLEPALREAARLVGADGLVYAESAVPLAPDVAAAAGLRIVRASRAGHVHFQSLQRA